MFNQAAAGTAAAVGTVQNANTNANLDSSNRRIDDNKNDVTNLKSMVATLSASGTTTSGVSSSTCSRVSHYFTCNKLLKKD